MALRALLLLLALPIVPFAAGCGEHCGLIAFASLALDVVDADTGEPIPDAMITYTVDGEEQDALTEQTFSGGHYVLGYEHPGSYAVHIEAPGHTPVDRDYEIADGECHVKGQRDTIELAPM